MMTGRQLSWRHIRQYPHDCPAGAWSFVPMLPVGTNGEGGDGVVQFWRVWHVRCPATRRTRVVFHGRRGRELLGELVIKSSYLRFQDLAALLVLLREVKSFCHEISKVRNHERQPNYPAFCRGFAFSLLRVIVMKMTTEPIPFTSEVLHQCGFRTISLICRFSPSLLQNIRRWVSACYGDKRHYGLRGGLQCVVQNHPLLGWGGEVGEAGTADCQTAAGRRNGTTPVHAFLYHDGAADSRQIFVPISVE